MIDHRRGASTQADVRDAGFLFPRRALQRA
jgi:hypothetical protein